VLGVALSMTFGVAVAQHHAVSGTVTDAATGDVIPGVNVSLKGTSTGTVTNGDGQYALTAPPDGTLVFSFIGFNAREIAVDGQTQINVGLETETIGLEEVIAIGYGTMRKR